MRPTSTVINPNPVAEPIAEVDDAPTAAAPRRRRSPIIDVAVILAGTYLLASMFGDVRYFLRSGTPTDLGEAATVIQAGDLAAWREHHVTLHGSPDVQHAARAKLGERSIGYLRLVEGGGSLFAAVTRSEDTTGNQFEGTFTGRLRRVSDVRMYPWLEQYFNGEQIIETHDLSTDQLRDAIAAGKFSADEQLTLRVLQPDARVQLGRQSFPSLARATAAVTAQGFPVFTPKDQSSSAFYTFFARIPEDQRQAVSAALEAASEVPPPDKPDPSHGAMVVAFHTNYVVNAAAVQREGEAILVPVGPQSNPGYIVEGDRLVPQPLSNGHLRVDLASLRNVGRLVPVRVNPEGHIILAGETPGDHWPSFVLSLLVLVLIGYNLASLVAFWRARQA